jgi:hypothetical protein
MSVLIGLRKEDDEQYVIKMKPQPARESIEETLSVLWRMLSCVLFKPIILSDLNLISVSITKRWGHGSTLK